MWHKADRQETPRYQAPYPRAGNPMIFVVLGVVAVVLTVAARATAPGALALGLAVMFMIVGAYFVRPILGICATVLFAMIADDFAMQWYPFVKGFSARESMMFLSKSVIFSPMEICVFAGIVGLFVRYLIYGRWPFRLGPVRKPLFAFLFFVIVGLGYGLVKGGSRKIALFQARPFFVMFGAYLLVASICRTRADYRRVLWSAIAAIEIHAIVALIHVVQLPAAAFELPESLFDHGPIMREDLLFVAAIASCLFWHNSRRQRTVLVVMIAPVAVVYMLAVRRAAIIALVAALILLCVLMFWRQRRTFIRVIPVCAVLAVGYTGAFWGSQSSLAFPAQAVKSVISPNQASQRNQGSDQYRTIENFDLNYTIRANKVLGIGLGQPFYRPIALPALGGFALNAYLPHNSIMALWVWFGLGGFVSFFCLLGRTLMLGAQKLREVGDGQDLSVLLTLVCGVVIFVVFASVDTAYGHDNMVMFALCLAAAANYPTPRRPEPAIEAEQNPSVDVGLLSRT